MLKGVRMDLKLLSEKQKEIDENPEMIALLSYWENLVGLGESQKLSLVLTLNGRSITALSNAKQRRIDRSKKRPAKK